MKLKSKLYDWFTCFSELIPNSEILENLRVVGVGQEFANLIKETLTSVLAQKI